MGAVDGVVFSGRYATCAAVIASDLLPRLELAGALQPHAGEWDIFCKPVEGVLADLAATHVHASA
jgi:hypothetical protein